jgi:hypothetical protein
MQDAKLLRSRLMALIASGGSLAAAVACGGTIAAPQDPDATAPAPTTPGTSPTSPPTAPTATPPRALDGGSFSCDVGRAATEVCYTRAQLEAGAPLVNCFGGGGPVDAGLPPASAYDPEGCLAPSYVCDGCCNRAASLPRVVGDKCCYMHCTGACCGRPLHVGGIEVRAETRARADWLAAERDATLDCDIDAVTRDALARAWLDDARSEHASVASFARFTLDLLAYGAPASLVEDAQRAALDEIHHARLCFSLASRFARAPQGPGPLPVQGVEIAASLVDAVALAVREGCIGETIAALTARAQLRVAEDPAVRAALEQIARDEEAHAALAWRFVAWALVTAPSPALREAVARAFAEASPSSAADGDPQSADRDVWRTFGRLTSAERRAVALAARCEVIAPCAEELMGVRPQVD